MGLPWLDIASGLGGILGGSSARKSQKEAMRLQNAWMQTLLNRQNTIVDPALQQLQRYADNPDMDPRERIDQRNTETDISNYYRTAIPQVLQSNATRGLSGGTFGGNMVQNALLRGTDALAQSRTQQLGQRTGNRLSALQYLAGSGQSPDFMSLAGMYGDQASSSLSGLSSLFGSLGMDRGEKQTPVPTQGTHTTMDWGTEDDGFGSLPRIGDSMGPSLRVQNQGSSILSQYPSWVTKKRQYGPTRR